jgi:hypothetical protein
MTIINKPSLIYLFDISLREANQSFVFYWYKSSIVSTPEHLKKERTDYILNNVFYGKTY